MDQITHFFSLRFVKVVQDMTRVSTYCLCWVMLGFVRATKINLVFVTSENPRFGLITSGPAFDVAIENMKRKFPEVLTQRNQIQRYEIYKAGIFSCDEAGVEMQFVAGQMANLIQQLDGFVVLLCSGKNESRSLAGYVIKIVNRYFKRRGVT